MPGASCLVGQQPACMHVQSQLYLKPSPQDSAVLPTPQKHPNQQWNEFAVSVVTDRHHHRSCSAPIECWAAPLSSLLEPRLSLGFRTANGLKNSAGPELTFLASYDKCAWSIRNTAPLYCSSVEEHSPSRRVWGGQTTAKNPVVGEGSPSLKTPCPSPV